jgi:hypothetical protein
MKFEDLMKPRENYYEAIPSNSLEDFLKTAETKRKAAAPISEEKKQVIKSEFSLKTPQQKAQEEAAKMQQETPVQEEPSIGFQEAPQELPQIPQEQMLQEQVAPKITIPSLQPEEAKKKEETLSDRAEKLMPERDWKNFLPYLAPLLVGAVSGGSYGLSSEVAGSQLLKDEADRLKRKQSLEDKLLEMDKAKLARKVASSKMQIKQLRSKATGEPVIGSYDPSSDTMLVQGQPVDTSEYELAPGQTIGQFQERQTVLTGKQKELGDYFGRGVIKDPETGLLAKKQDGKLIPIQVSRNQLNPEQVKNLDKLVTGFKTTDVYKKNADTLRFATTVQELLKEGNPIAVEMARSELAKSAEGGGRLSDADIERLGGSKAIREQIDRFSNLQKTGEPATAKDIAFMQRVADILEAKARKSLTQSINGLEQDFMQKGGVAGAVQTALNPYAPQLAQKPSAESGISAMVKVVSPEGKFGFIPRKNLNLALKKRYKVVK